MPILLFFATACRLSSYAFVDDARQRCVVRRAAILQEQRDGGLISLFYQSVTTKIRAKCASSIGLCLLMR